MARREESILVLLAALPWWVSICVGLVAYVALKFVIPSLPIENPLLRSLAQYAPQFAWAAIIFLLPAAFSVFNSTRKRDLLDRQSGIESIRSLSWQQFEELLGEAFRRQGYSVRENVSKSADGGVDLRITRDGNVYLVQCKHWRAYKVGVNVAREMLGLVSARGAHGAIIVTSGTFTQEARSFASGRPIDLVEGQQLVEMIRAVQDGPAVAARVIAAEPRPKPVSERPTAVAKRCPRCGEELVVREARRGPRAGSKFWGCSGYPGCKYTEEYAG